MQGHTPIHPLESLAWTGIRMPERSSSSTRSSRTPVDLLRARPRAMATAGSCAPAARDAGLIQSLSKSRPEGVAAPSRAAP